MSICTYISHRRDSNCFCFVWSNHYRNGNLIVISGSAWTINPYSLGLLHWPWNNNCICDRKVPLQIWVESTSTLPHQNTTRREPWTWASYQIRKIDGCACAGNAGNVSPPTRVSIPDMHHGTCVTHVPWCMPGSLTSGFLWSRWRGKRSRRVRNLQCYVSGNRPMYYVCFFR